MDSQQGVIDFSLYLRTKREIGEDGGSTPGLFLRNSIRIVYNCPNFRFT